MMLETFFALPFIVQLFFIVVCGGTVVLALFWLYSHIVAKEVINPDLDDEYHTTHQAEQSGPRTPPVDYERQ